MNAQSQKHLFFTHAETPMRPPRQQLGSVILFEEYIYDFSADVSCIAIPTSAICIHDFHQLS